MGGGPWPFARVSPEPVAPSGQVGGSAIAVRPASRADVAAIHAIERASFGDPWSVASFEQLIDDTGVDFRVAAEDGAVAGYVILRTVLDESELANIAVRPSGRGRGLGAGLLDAVLATAERSGVVATHLEVRESNAAARALYRSRGFVEVRRRLSYYRRPVEDAIVMVRGRAGGIDAVHR